MNDIKRMTFMVVVLFILAVAMGFGTGWKIVVIMAAVVDLMMIAKKIIKR